MSETSRVAPEVDVETPVNPYSLLDAVNSSSATGCTAWLIFITLMMYLMVAVAGVTHKDLLLETPVALPILQVHIPQARFFLFAPVLVVLLHSGLLTQLVLLTHKTLLFDAAVRSLELSERRVHPLRLELHPFFLTQTTAGPHRGVIVSAVLYGLSWLTLVVLPVFLLLTIQIVFLPYHDATITGAHRAALVVDIALLIAIGIFLTRAETSFFKAVWRSALLHPLSVPIVAAVVALSSSSLSSWRRSPARRSIEQAGRSCGWLDRNPMRPCNAFLPVSRRRSRGTPMVRAWVSSIAT
jgi:hypothetical protein